MIFTMTRIVGKALLSAIMLFALGFPASAQSGTPTKVRVVVLSEIMTILPFWIAQETGRYRQAGLDLEIIQARSGADAGRILISGSADIGILVAAHAMKALELGQPLRVVQQLTVNSTLGIVTRKDLGIKPGDWQALKGKRFGMTSAGSDTDLLLRAALAKHGIDPKRDVTIVAVGGAVEAIATFKRRDIDGFLALPGMRGLLLAEDLISEFWGFKNDPILAGGPSIAVVTRDQYRSENPAAVRGFVKATLAAVQEFYAKPEVSAEVASKVYKFPAQVIRLELDNFRDVTAFPADGLQNKFSYEATLQIYREAGLLKKDLPFDDVYAAEYLK